MGPDNLCENGACYPACVDCTTRNNIHFHCTQDTSYFSQWAPRVRFAHNIGLEAQFRWDSTVDVVAANNIMANRLRLRDDAADDVNENNLEYYGSSDFNDKFVDADNGDFTLVDEDDV